MPQKSRIESPASYSTSFAVGFSDPDGDLALVSASSPLPVSLQADPPPPTPMAGIAAASGLVGPYPAASGVPIHLQLAGTWQGRISLVRSVDGGVTTHGLTAAGMRWASFTANMNEVVWQDSDASASFYLGITLVSGAVSYRVSQ